jgi:hypothetical protein
MNTNNTNTEVSHPSPTVESLMDEQNSTCCIDSYKGRPTFAINKESPYPFSFGLLKARLIVKHMEALQKFVESDGRSLV